MCHCGYTCGDLLFVQVCTGPAPVHCSCLQGKLQSPLFSAALQTRLTAGRLSLRLHLWRSAFLYRCAVPSPNALQLCSGQNAISTVQCWSANQAHCRKFVIAVTPLETCSHDMLSYRFAVAQHQCTAALFKAKCSPHCAVLVYKPGSQQAVCHCGHTCGDLLFIQVCSGPAPVHCSSLQGKMQSSLCSAGLQTRLTAGSVSLRSHLWRSALHTGLQWPSTSALQLSSRQNAVLTVQCWFTNQAHCRQCVTAVTPVETRSSYRFAVAQHQCTAALFKAKCSPHCAMLVYKPGSLQEVCHCVYTCGDLLSYRFAVAQHQCTAALFKAKCSPHCAMLVYKPGSQQAVCHCGYTCGDMLFIQICSGPAPVHCSFLQCKMQFSLCSAGLQTRLTAGSVSLRLHLWRFALHTGLQWPSTSALQLSSRQNAVLTVQCWFTNQAHSRQFVIAVTPSETCSSYRFAVAQHQCTAALFKAKRSPHCAMLVYKPGSLQAVCHCGYTCGDTLFIQVCSGPAPVHCSSLQGKMQSSLCSAGLQTRLTAGSVSLRLHLWRSAFCTDVQCPAPTHCSSV